MGKGLISTLPSTEAHTWAILFDNEIFTEYISYKKVFFLGSQSNNQITNYREVVSKFMICRSKQENHVITSIEIKGF